MTNNKRLTIKSVLVALVATLFPFTASAHDFEAVNAQSVTMYFNVLDEAERTAAVTFYGDNYSNVPSDKKYSGAVIIPETIVRTIPPAVEGDEPTTATYTVTQVGDRAFYGCSGLTEITIPAGITAIGQSAFYNCTGLTALNYNAVNCSMPSSSSYAVFGSAGKYANYVYEMVVRIGEGVETIPAYFGYNMRAKSVYIPSTVTSIGTWSLGSVSGLKEVHIADLAAWCAIDFNNTSSAQPLANSNALLYLGDEQITDLRIPDGVTEVKPYAFYKGTFTSIDLNNVQTIGDYAFAYAKGYTELTIDNTVTSVGKYAFRESSVATLNYNNTVITAYPSDAPFYYSQLKTINLGTEVTAIPEYAFCGCNKLEEITIPERITSIGRCAFSSCSGVRTIHFNAPNCTMPTSSDFAAFRHAGSNSNPATVYIGENVETIPSYAFYYTYVGEIHIPASVTTIGRYAFNQSCMTAVFIEDLAKWCAIEFGDYNANPLYSGSSVCKLYVNNVAVDDLVIPDGVTEIKPYAFARINISSLDLNETQAIGKWAFAYAKGFTELTIDDHLTSVGEYAFYYSSIETLNYNNTVITAFPSSAPFASSNLATIILGDDVTQIPAYAFQSCSKLTEITIPERITSIGRCAFSSCSGVRTIHFNAPNCTMPTSSDYAAFRHAGSNSNPATVYIGENVEVIPSYAFCYTYVGEIHIPASVTTIGRYAFNQSCMTAVFIEDLAKWCAIEFGDDNANPLYSGSSVCKLYVNNVAVDDLRIPDGVTEIKPYAFARINISSLDLNETQTIGKWAFAYAKGFTELTMDDHLTSVGEYAFYYSSIETLNYNNNVIESFPSSNAAFSSSNLKTINWGENVTRIPAYAFIGCYNLKEITIPERFTFIGDRAFGSCTGLRTIHLNAQNCTLQYSSGYSSSGPFFGVSSSSNPATVYVAEGITSISPYAFYNSNIGYVYLPSTVENIGTHAFYACSYLKEFHSDITNPADVTLGTYAFYNQSSCKLLVPNGTSALYSVAPQWKDFQNIGEAYLLLTDGEPYTNNELITHCAVDYVRTFTSDNWQALYVPYNMDYAEWSKYGKVAALTGVETEIEDGEEVTTLVWTTIESGELTAGTPYIFKPNSFYGSSRKITFIGKARDVQPATEQHEVCPEGSNWTLYGTYTEKTDMADDEAYALASGTFKRTTSNDKTLKPLRIYLKANASVMNAPAMVRSKIISENGEATYIEGIKEDNSQFSILNSQLIFDLSGRRVSDDTKGIIIVNGRKEVRK